MNDSCESVDAITPLLKKSWLTEVEKIVCPNMDRQFDIETVSVCLLKKDSILVTTYMFYNTILCVFGFFRFPAPQTYSSRHLLVWKFICQMQFTVLNIPYSITAIVALSAYWSCFQPIRAPSVMIQLYKTVLAQSILYPKPPGSPTAKLLWSMQEVTKRSRLFGLTKRALVD